jgi:ribose transport system ATP-binding protein
VLALRAIRKSFAAPVLDGVDLELRSGEVHALLGANGAGKSTLARIVAGIVAADGGAMELDGVAYAPRTKAEAEHLGVQMVPQELNLVANLSVGENLFLSSLPRRRGFIDRAELESRARAALSRVGLSDLDPARPVEGLGIGVQQQLEIAKALARSARVLLFDEPTAALTEPQVETLFRNIRRLVDGGVLVLYVSHRLEEMRRIADRATILRDGKVVVSDLFSRLSPEEIVRAMVGGDVERESKHRKRALGERALRVEGLTLGRRVADVAFEVRRGEIFGLSGLIGSGRTSLLRAIFGAEPADAGGVALGEEGSLRRFRAPVEAARAGLAMIPEDRKRHGLLLSRSIVLNTVLGILRRVPGPSWRPTAVQALDRLNVRRRSPEQPVRELSGGNQQKVMIARWLLRDAAVVLFDEPTRGVDVSSRAAIYHLMNELAGRGKGIVVASSDLDELLGICDRIGVLSAGRLVEVFEREGWSPEAIAAAAFRGYLG